MAGGVVQVYVRVLGHEGDGTGAEGSARPCLLLHATPGG